jgi:hypothetical protein
VDALAQGKKAAAIIERYLEGRPLRMLPEVRLPEIFLEPLALVPGEGQECTRPRPPELPLEARKGNLNEIELALPEGQARCEARRCMRCDLEFTQKKAKKMTAAGHGD